MTKLIDPIDCAATRGARKQAQDDCRSWRAMVLRESADRLDRHIEKLKRQAAEYRGIADRLTQQISKEGEL